MYLVKTLKISGNNYGKNYSEVILNLTRVNLVLIAFFIQILVKRDKSYLDKKYFKRTKHTFSDTHKHFTPSIPKY